MDTLKIENIKFQYNNKQKILSNISFEMKSNQIIGLFGDSGSGKTTLCKILTGFLKKYKGTININDEKVPTGFNPIQLIYQHPEKIMNPRWNMERILHESWIPSKEILDSFGIKNEWFKRFPSELSGGELQRFSILRAINPKTKFIIADEITTMLDSVTQVQIWNAIIKHCQKQDIGILAVSHDKLLLETVCDDIIYFNELNKS
ncbi:MAG: ATP-binding cassette domain-containing protein [Methanobacteriaceae archaeon]|nr:ATP-binding cassette domain-containing protein [Methanobacteriaceae archaeon]